MSTTEAAVELSGAGKRFGPVQALRDVDLTIAPGEVVALLGPNGAGKTTAISLMLGLRKPTAGRAWRLLLEAGRGPRRIAPQRACSACAAARSREVCSPWHPVMNATFVLSGPPTGLSERLAGYPGVVRLIAAGLLLLRSGASALSR